MTKDEKDILEKVFSNLLNLHTIEEYNKLKGYIKDSMNSFAHEYALHNHNWDRERYLIWHEIVLMLDETNLYDTREH